MAASFFEGDRAGALQPSHEVNRFIDVLKRVGPMGGGNTPLAQLGIGSGAVRLPLKELASSPVCLPAG